MVDNGPGVPKEKDFNFITRPAEPVGKEQVEDLNLHLFRSPFRNYDIWEEVARARSVLRAAWVSSQNLADSADISTPSRSIEIVIRPGCLEDPE